MADENKPAFYPRVGNIKAKNFRSAQPPAFVEDPRAMDLPQYGDVDLSVPTKENLEMGRRMAERDAQLRRQQQADRSPLEKLAGGLQAGRLIGSGLVQSVASIPTAITKGSKAAEEYIAENMYKPTQPLAYEYAGDVGDFLEKLETQYKIPPILPEAVALQYLTGPATAQAARAAGKGAVKAGMELERRMEPVVKGALEQGGLPREMALGMGANTQSNVIKPKGGNWIGGDVEQALDPLITKGIISNREIPYGPEFDSAIIKRIADLKETASAPGYKGGAGRVASMLEEDLQDAVSTQNRVKNAAINKWVQSNLTNYVKKDMGTPDDPVRKLAEQDISHLPQDLQNIEMTWTPEELAKTRKRFGFPEEETATNPTAKMWEQMADEMIAPSRATEFGEKARQQNPWLEKLNPYDTVYETMRGLPQALKFDHIVDVLREDLTTGRIRPEQLNKVSMEQAVRRTFEYDQEMARKMAADRMTSRAELPVYKEYPEGLKWVELNRPGDFAAESKAMGHSVKGYEPPQNSPDWTESSGDSGSSSYGLGGWDAIKSGQAKVYSLVDAKGEPHVTIEVGKGKHPIGFTGDGNNFPYGLRYGEYDDNYAKIPEEKQLEIYNLGKKLYFENPNAYAENRILTGEQAPNLMDVFQKAADMLLGERPGYVRQIKGKGNARPISKYDPYTQDFVKRGGWSDVRDLQNTGLFNVDGRYFTEPELIEVTKKYGRMGVMDTPWEVARQRHIEAGVPEEEALRNWVEGFKEGRGRLELPRDMPPDLEGMKRGGVVISNNPDTMMLELGNQKMKNGVPAYGAGKAVTKQALKAAKPEAMKASEALGKIEGRPLKITQADRTKVGGGYLGGPGFSGLQLTEPEYRAAEAAWAVQNAGTAKTILGGGGDNAVYAAMLGTPTQHQSNQMVFDKLLGDFRKAAKRGELTPELRDLINMRLASAVDKKGNPVFPADVDIMDKKFRDVADTFSRRSIAGHLMGGVQVGGKKGQIIDYDKIIRNTTDPDLLDQPTGALGNRLFTLSGGIIDRPDLHPAFPTILQGEDLGVMFTPVERDIVMKDFVEKTMREKGRKPGYMDYTRGNPPTQLITEDILTELQKLGKKKGGAVKQPAAYIDGSEFVEAAQKYGIKDSMGNLNMIVNLVNKGFTVDDAARQVADSGMHKAEGGEVSGDDLILEERPL
jgi:hypothetical protein